MYQPDTIGSERCAEGDVMGMLVRGVGIVRVDVAVNRFAVVAVRVGVEVPASPAKEQPCSEEDYDDTQQSLSSLLHRPRQVTSNNTSGRPMRTRDVPCPRPQENPSSRPFSSL